MKWFGPAPFSLVCTVTPRTSTPRGLCIWCQEGFTESDSGLVVPFLAEEDAAYHRECFLRQTFGSVGHQLKTCSCYGGTEEDPPELSLREAARLAVEMFTTTAMGGGTAH